MSADSTCERTDVLEATGQRQRFLLEMADLLRKLYSGPKKQDSRGCFIVVFVCVCVCVFSRDDANLMLPVVQWYSGNFPFPW